MFRKDMLGSRIKEVRLLRGLTQSELGEKVGCGNKNISRYEKGVRLPPSDVLYAIAKALSCSTDYLLGATNELNRFIGDIGADHYEIVVSDDSIEKPYTPEQFVKLINKLESIGVDVDKLLNN